MNIVEAMERRHAVRDFSDRPIDDDTLRALNEAVDAANADGGLDVQLVQDDTDAFGGCPTHYGRFKNVRYCIALIGSDDEDPAQLDRKVGYYGERLALTATQLGMGSIMKTMTGRDEDGGFTQHIPSNILATARACVHRVVRRLPGFPGRGPRAAIRPRRRARDMRDARLWRAERL